MATTKALISALKIWDKDFENIYMYEINSPIKPKLINSISLWMKNSIIKREKSIIYLLPNGLWILMSLD